MSTANFYRTPPVAVFVRLMKAMSSTGRLLNFFKKTILKNGSELTLGSDCLELSDCLKLCFLTSLSKPSWFSYITKIPVAFELEL